MTDTNFVQQLLENEVEFKSSILQMDISKDFDFFKKDLILGNIDNFEKRFIDIVFDLISDMQHFSRTIVERQYVVMLRLYEKKGDYHDKIKNEINQYNSSVAQLLKKLKEAYKNTEDEGEKSDIDEKIRNVRMMNVDEYILLLARREAVNSFFKTASEKLIILVYSKLGVSRSKGGWQQKMLMEKSVKQTYKDMTKKSGGLFGFKGKKKEVEQ